MTVNQIITITIAAINLFNFVFYFWMLRKNSKVIQLNDVSSVIKNIPEYVKQAKMLYGSNKLSITNYVLAMLNKDCENLKIKYQEKLLKKEIEKEIKNPTLEVNSND